MNAPVPVDAWDVPGPVRERAEPIQRTLAEASGDSLAAVLLFGSRMVGADPNRFSAFDLVALVDDYATFHRHLTASGHHERPAWLLTALARVLAPNVVAFDPGLESGDLAKILVLTVDDFERALSPRAKDHFVIGRMLQRVGVLGSRDERVRARVISAIRGARDRAPQWVAPWLEGPFDASSFALRMLEVSYAGEIRPESADRVRMVFEAQQAFLERTYTRVLERAQERGLLERAEDGWIYRDPPGRLARWGVRWYFLRSKVRSTLRWFKHTVTFNDWITYVQRKVERRTGLHVPVTPLERRFPYVLLWPKVFRVLKARKAMREAGRS